MCLPFAAEDRHLPEYHALKMQSDAVSEESHRLAGFLRRRRSCGAAIVHRYDRSRAKDPLIDEQLEEVTEIKLDLRHSARNKRFYGGRFPSKN